LAILPGISVPLACARLFIAHLFIPLNSLLAFNSFSNRASRKSVLDDNIQKACSLVIGQHVDLLQSKLKQQSAWSTMSQEQNSIASISLSLIETVTSRFEDQKFYHWLGVNQRPTSATSAKET
jgi:membrane carboxypeptidase/penicillin-binding protein PbpC